MSDKKVRSKEEIQLEFQNLCLKAGYIQYQAFIANKDLDMVNKALHDLNLEESARAAKEADAVKEEVKS